MQLLIISIVQVSPCAGAANGNPLYLCKQTFANLKYEFKNNSFFHCTFTKH